METSEDSGEKSGKGSSMLGPDRYAPRLHDIALSELREAGIRGLIVDLDNTLLGFGCTELAAEHLAWIEEAHERGFAIVMISNNFSDRVYSVAKQLRIDCIPNALKPLPFGYWRALRRLGLPRKQVVVVGDQLFTDVLGAKLCGNLFTILTEPIQKKDFPITSMFRFLERLVLRRRQ
ncbi:MAG TPA: YqeG family HAD IIIA-type phosphatase [Candidatus Rubrimentiphilum sp.]|nr:YqeG family HAD IIIA-type phosphatase [Candidatus Rubrimentiphilum sp.]